MTIIFTYEQLKYLMPDGEETYRFVPNENISQKDIEELLNIDEDCVTFQGFHLITNYKELHDIAI